MVEVYHPADLLEALEIRKETGAVPFSGGTDIMVRYRTSPGVLPDLPWDILLVSHLRELQYITDGGRSIRIGSETVLTDIAASPLVPDLLRKAVSLMAAPALRNLATLAGNIGNASPAGDAVCALIALDGKVTLSSSAGDRVLSLEEFITGPGKTVMRSDEFITEIEIPTCERSHTLYRKVGTRRANALSKLSFCGDALVRGNIIEDVRIAVGAAAPVVVRSRAAEQRFSGMTLNELVLAEPDIISDYASLIVPIDDQRSTASYRKQTALNLVSLFIESLLKEG